MKLTRKIVATLAVVALAAPALAGEITGSGKFTPVHYYTASSICAFSGYNDTPGEDGFGRVQAYGMLVRSFGGFVPGSDMHPGQACRG